MQAVPEWLADVPASKRAALGNAPPDIPQWYKTASAHDHEHLKTLISTAWTAQTKVDQAMAHLKSPEDFGAPLLQDLLKQRFGVELDVRTTYLRLYIPQTAAWLPIRTGARTWTVSLLAAALHNFEAGEEYEADSGFITQPGSTGQFQPLAAIDRQLKVAQFTALCRELDIGGQYQRYLNQYFDFTNPVAATTFRSRVKQSQVADLNVALQMARMKKDLLDDQSAERLQRLLSPQGNPQSCYPLLCYDLTILTTTLTGIVLFAEDIEGPREVSLIAYIPHDPIAPLKQYPTLIAFMNALGNNLRSAEYQQFFSRFVNHEERGPFFANLNSRLSKVTWHPHTPGDPQPSWRETPIDTPRLRFSTTLIRADLFNHLFQRKISKVYNDARTLAVSTASADQKARWARWDIIETIATQILEIAAFIAAPLVPPVGMMMLACSAYQMLDTAIEGVIDWTRGDMTEAIDHFFSFVEQVLQLGLFVGGAPLIVGQVRKVLPTRVVNFFDNLKPIKLPNGKARLWNTSLTPYAHDLPLPEQAAPGPQGLHAYNDKNILKLSDQPFVVETDPVTQQPYLQHPSRPNAYRPALMTNGKGAWLTELDTPASWDSTTLMKRQGPQTFGLSDEKLATIRRISGTEEGALRKMYIDQQPPPPLLTDTLERFKIDQALQDLISQMNIDDPAIYSQADAQTQLQLLTSLDLWPKTKTLRFLDAQGRTAWELAGENGSSVAQIHEAQLNNGDLLKTLLETLDEPQRKTLLGETANEPATSLPTRALKLRKKLAGLAQSHRRELFASRYRKAGLATTPRQQTLADHTPGLPISAAEVLLDSASSLELEEIDAGTVPARLSQLAESLRDEAALNHTYEGLYLDATDTLDTHRLALHSLERLPGWGKKVRLEIRSAAPESALLDAIGKPKARILRTLVRSPEGRYTPEDSKGPLFGETDLYTAILQALPDAERDAIGLHIGQGQALRQSLRTHALQREPLRTLITAEPARKPTDTRTHLRLLGMDNYPAAPQAAHPAPTPRALARSLYPAHSDAQIEALVQSLSTRPGGGLPLLTAMREEYEQLSLDLSRWEASTSRRHPDSEVNMSRQEYRDARQNRRLFAEEVRRCWRQETEVDGFFQPATRNGSKLRATGPLSGELPALRASFEHISYMELVGNRTALKVDAFLRSFPRLRHLSINQAQLGQLPTGLSSLTRLNTLILDDCRIRLTPQALSTLTAMNRLRTLDLVNNPLGLVPSVEGMPDMGFLDLSHTGISELPAGLLSRPALTQATLSYNQITALPAELFDLPADSPKTLDLRGNPLSRATLDRVKAYYQSTGRYWSIDAPASNISQAKRLFPDFNTLEINRFIFSLPGTLEMGQIELARLEAEYTELTRGLDTWTRRATTPEEQSRREAFKKSVQTCWRREGPLDLRHPQVNPTFILENPEPFSGEFPSLNNTLSHVSSIHLTGDGAAFPLHSSLFLRGFPTLNQLTVERFVLGDIPASVFELPQLSSLRLSDCSLTLSAETATSLTTLGDLQQLDLSHNPLGRFPDFSALPKLSSINLEETGLLQIPESLLASVERTNINLSNNLITEIPSSAFKLPLRVTAAFDLSGNQLSASALTQIKHYCQRIGGYFQADLPAGMQQRIEALYPSFTENQTKRFFFELPGGLDAAVPALERLEAEFEQLSTDLQQWALDSPTRHPVLDTPLDEQTRAQDQLNRLRFKTSIEDAWRRDTELDDEFETFATLYKLVLNVPILGELPELTARFDHVSSLELVGEYTTTQANGLLKCFTELRSLDIAKYTLGEIPSSVFTLSKLEVLSLTDSAVVLTTASTEALSQMHSLRYLDLSDNMLGLSPNVSQMHQLESLYLQANALTELPQGLFALHELRTLDLSDNLLMEMPADLLELSTPLDHESDLSGNPWSAQSLDHFRRYYLQTGNDLEITQANVDAAGNPLVRPDSPEPMEE